jgi:hypothetical protein
VAVAVAAYRLEHIRAPSLGPGSRPIPSYRHFQLRLRAVVLPEQLDGRGGNQEESTQQLAAVHPVRWDARDSLGKAKFPEEVLRARSDEPEKPVDSK